MQQWGKCIPDAIETKSALCDIACGGNWEFEPKTYSQIISCICHIENCAKSCHNCAYSLNMRNVCAFTHEQVMHCRDCCTRCIDCCKQTGRAIYREGQTCIRGGGMSSHHRRAYIQKHNQCVEKLVSLMEQCGQCIRECDMAIGA